MSGVNFPVDDTGKRSTTTPAKTIWCGAFEGCSDQLVSGIREEQNWRHKYGDHVYELTKESLKSPEASIKVAENGLKAVYETFDFVRDGESCKLAQAMEKYTDTTPMTGFVESKGETQVDLEKAVSIPFDSNNYSGDELIELLQSKAEAGEIEQDVVESIKKIITNAKDWRDSLKDTYFVLFGATSELCPFEKLLELGLNVIAVARPNAERQARLIEAAECAPKGATLTVPVLKPVDDAKKLEDKGFLASVCGCDIITHAPELRNWLVSLYPGKRFCIGSYIYLDGAKHVLASVAMDAVLKDVLKHRENACLTYLGTPAVVYPITKAAYEDSKRRFEESRPWWQSITSAILGPYTMNMSPPVVADSIDTRAQDQAKEIYLFNGIANVQGPNYLLAKTIQNWRVVVTREVLKRRVSVNMAPTCKTDSVMHVASVANAVRGMKVFAPLVAYEPESAKGIMGLLLIYDMCSEDSAANPAVILKNPMEIFATNGVHGGLW
eukprot:CAMPEP_0203772464 /NCGR_PEP_ID=MMETSP0099_2-20121227/4055_1 /ASSEMBLY_ACC=CAM_ASM_000209 /TAXON_ID=96639 /ORGANISM=" , Strain NY0313808BC1" /LENGTH=495 /DNA_ID=CAMNT_0050670063 /DNA_START=83 /DNA_END=1567 /DNA_ORIENTATION=-